MRNTLKKALIFLFPLYLSLLLSCEVQLRKYRPGFYMAHRKHAGQSPEQTAQKPVVAHRETMTVNEEIIKISAQANPPGPGIPVSIHESQNKAEVKVQSAPASVKLTPLRPVSVTGDQCECNHKIKRGGPLECLGALFLVAPASGSLFFGIFLFVSAASGGSLLFIPLGILMILLSLVMYFQISRFCRQGV